MCESRSWLSSTVLEEGAVQEGGQLRPIVLQDGREAWGTEGRGPPCRPPRLAAPSPHTSPRGRSRSAPARRPGLGHCQLRQGKPGHETRSAACPPPPPPGVPPTTAAPTPQPTWEQVIGELPMKPVLQHQEQSELRRRRQEGVVGSGRPVPLLPHQASLPAAAPPHPKLTCQRAWSSLLSRLHCIWITCGEDTGQGHSKAGPQPLAASADAASRGRAGVVKTRDGKNL